MKLIKFFKEQLKLPTLLGVIPEAEEQRNNISLDLVAVTKVTNATEQTVAVNAARDCQTYIKSVKDRGLEFRRPINDFLALVKKTEDDHLAPLITEQERIKKLCADFQEKEARRVAKEEEEQRQAREKAERERQALEEKARQAAIKAAATGRAADEKKAAAVQAAAEAAEQVAQTMLMALLPEKARDAGMSVKKVLKWEVTDIRALVAARPDLCNIEPSGRAIQAVCIPEMPNKPPGLKLWWENQTVFQRR
jgi:predicted  nucleic acid-binding Zn-ribbon protein